MGSRAFQPRSKIPNGELRSGTHSGSREHSRCVGMITYERCLKQRVPAIEGNGARALRFGFGADQMQ